MNTNDFTELLSRGIAEIIGYDQLLKDLQNSRTLRLKCGFDPSFPDIHLGHMVVLRKLRQFQELGHKVVLLVGDWTAQIGDPSGKSQTRPMLSAQQVKENAATYMEQFFRIVDREKTEVRWQSEWLASYGLLDVFTLTSHFTVAQLLAREDFNNRFAAQQPITVTEFIYPMLQGFDSVMLRNDIEFGGTDQKFNMLVGRDLQEQAGQKPQGVLMVPLLVGTDGSKKMSKSLGNYIGIADDPANIFGKVMSIKDEALFTYFELLTDVPIAEIAQMRDSVLTGANPMLYKKKLAQEIIIQLYSKEEAIAAQDHFERVVQNKETPDQIAEYKIDFSKSVDLKDLLFQSGLAESKAAASRLISQGSVSVDGQKIISGDELKSGDVIRVGKRRYIKIC